MKKDDLILELSGISNRIKSLIDKNHEKITYSFKPGNLQGKMNFYIIGIYEEFNKKDSGKILQIYDQYIRSCLNILSSCLATLSIVFKEENNHKSLDSLFALSRIISECAIKLHYITYAPQKESAQFLLSSSIKTLMDLFSRAENEERKKDASAHFRERVDFCKDLLIKFDLPFEADIEKYNSKEKRQMASFANQGVAKIHEKSLPNLENSFKEIGMRDYKESARKLLSFYQTGNMFIHPTDISSMISSKNKHFWNALIYINGSLISLNLLLKLIPENKSKKVMKDFQKIKNDFIRLQPEIIKNYK